MRLSGVLLFAVILLTSCFKSPDKERLPVAAVGHAVLYEEDISGMIPVTMSSQDSIDFVRKYVESWIEQQVILREATVLLNPREKDFSRKIREYRNALMVFEWEKKILREKLDTTISVEEIRDYYNTNQHEFILQADIVRVLYIRLNINNALRETAKELLKSEPFDGNEAEQFCRKYAVNYFLDVRSWLYVDDILKEIPLNATQKNEMLTGNAFIELNDNEYMYLLKVLEVKVNGSVSPLALEEKTIREVILQKRKSEIIDSHAGSLKAKAEREGRIKRFDNE